MVHEHDNVMNCKPDGDCFYEERFALEDAKKHFVLRVQTVCLAQNAVARLQAVLHQKQVDGFLRTITLYTKNE